MKQGYTHITFVIDRSGSMSSCWNDVVGGYEQFIKEQKTGAGECTLSLIAFDSKYEKPLDFIDIKVVTENINDLNINPRGSTALHDAIGRAIVETGEKLAKLSDDYKPEKVLVVVQTDGYENCSREFNAKTVKEKIKHQEEKYNWKFMFLGANKDACVSASRDLGFSVDTVAYYDSAKTGMAINSINTKMLNARSAVNSDEYARSVKYSAEELKQLS